MIEIKNLSKSFKLSKKQRKTMGPDFTGDKVFAVKDVSFSCQPGRVFSLLGANGAGKTTTLRMIATMLKPTSGSISVCGLDTVREDRKVRQKLGFQTGSTLLYERLTPNEVIKFFADLNDVDRSTFKQRKEELFTDLDIHSFADRQMGKLSTGMKQKVSIARTMIHDPEVVVFDEPTSGLDVITAKHIINLIRNCRDKGKTVIFSTHIMSEVNMLSDDLAIIHKGQLIYNGTFDEFKAEMKSETLEDEFILLAEKASSYEAV